MTTKELCEEYVEMYSCKKTERMEEIIKEIETSIRKEVLEEIYNTVDKKSGVGDLWVDALSKIEQYALSKGITLK